MRIVRMLLFLYRVAGILVMFAFISLRYDEIEIFESNVIQTNLFRDNIVDAKMSLNSKTISECTTLSCTRVGLFYYKRVKTWESTASNSPIPTS